MALGLLLMVASCGSADNAASGAGESGVSVTVADPDAEYPWPADKPLCSAVFGEGLQITHRSCNAEPDNDYVVISGQCGHGVAIVMATRIHEPRYTIWGYAGGRWKRANGEYPEDDATAWTEWRRCTGM